MTETHANALPEVSRRSPDELSAEDCKAELRQLREYEPPGWRTRFRNLINRINTLEGIAGRLFAQAGPRDSELPDNGPGDDPLAARVRAVMDSGSKKQTGPLVPTPGRAGWGDDGHITATVDFDWSLITGATDSTEPAGERDYGKLLGMLITGAMDAETVGRRAILLGFKMKAPGAPQTLSDLGRVMGISKQGADAALTRFEEKMPEIAKELGFDG